MKLQNTAAEIHFLSRITIGKVGEMKTKKKQYIYFQRVVLFILIALISMPVLYRDVLLNADIASSLFDGMIIFIVSGTVLLLIKK
jgi:hypothetical protein